jgi:4-hydroxyphenylacetate 3-hydroxylase N terminal
VLNDIGGVVTRVGDETVGEMWSLFDGQDILDEVDPAFSENICRHIDRVVRLDPFHVSANTDPKGDRSKRPQEQGSRHASACRKGDRDRSRHPSVVPRLDRCCRDQNICHVPSGGC